MRIIFDTIFITVISLLFYLAQPLAVPKVTYVPQGSIGRIITQLAIHNTEIYPPLDKVLLSFIGQPQAGWIDMGGGVVSKGDFLYRLSHAKAALKSITLIPGETAEIFFEQLSNELNLSAQKLKAEYENIAPIDDGWLVPDTYNVPVGIDEKALISYLVATSSQAQKALSNELLGEYDEQKWLRFLTIASIVQKESANTLEMPIVASVIYNRLDKNMKLQMDGTLNYGHFSHIRVTPERIRNDRSLYNTYIYSGLPPKPVCAVSREALKAAIEPIRSEFLYFVKANDGKHLFSRTYQEHLKNIKNQK